MTNFEKWKSELTIDNLAKTVDSLGLSCRLCPAHIQCGGNCPCEANFIKWANAEAETE